MRHFYIRLIIGIIMLFVAIVSAIRGGIVETALYAVLSAAFIISAILLYKKKKNDRK